MSREMRDSGVEWIGPIPKEAEAIRLRFLTSNYKAGPFGSSLITNNLLTEGEILVYTPEHVTNKNTESEKGNLYLPEERKSSMQQFSVNPGDIIFPIVGSLGKAMYIDASMPNGIINQRLAKFRVKEESIYIPYFLLLFADSDIYKPYYELNSHGVAVVNVTKDMIKDFPFIVYPIEEQKQIMRFLDRKCSAIDAAIEKTKESIGKLEEYKKAVITKAVTKGLDPDAKMKDSGVEWIGQIPEEWDILRGKFIYKKLSRPVKDTDDVITCFRDGEVTLRKNRREEGFTFSDKEIGYQGIEPGDLVVHGMDGFAGSIGISDSRGKATPVLNVLDSKQNKKYYMYYLRSMAYGDVFNAIATGIRVRSCNLNWNKLAELSYPVPSKETQQAIVNYIDNKLAKTDALIAKKQEVIGKWEEYKRSLIYYAVTGKIDCRNEIV